VYIFALLKKDLERTNLMFIITFPFYLLSLVVLYGTILLFPLLTLIVEHVQKKSVYQTQNLVTVSASQAQIFTLFACKFSISIPIEKGAGHPTRSFRTYIFEVIKFCPQRYNIYPTRAHIIRGRLVWLGQSVILFAYATE
jgi:hypothetical protein